MTDEIDLEVEIGRLQIQVTALKALAVGILCAIGNRDNAMLQEILDSIPKPASDGVTPLNPTFKAFTIALNEIVDDLRSVLSGQ